MRVGRVWWVPRLVLAEAASMPSQIALGFSGEFRAQYGRRRGGCLHNVLKAGDRRRQRGRGGERCSTPERCGPGTGRPLPPPCRHFHIFARPPPSCARQCLHCLDMSSTTDLLPIYPNHNLLFEFPAVALQRFLSLLEFRRRDEDPIGVPATSISMTTPFRTPAYRRTMSTQHRRRSWPSSKPL